MSAAAAIDTRSGARRWSKSCGVCRRTFGASEWQALPFVTTVSAASVQEHLSVPAAWTIELRRCACGASLATRSP